MLSFLFRLLPFLALIQSRDVPYPDVQQQSHEDHEVRPLAAVKLADEIGAEEGQGIGQDADRDGKDERSAACGLELEELDKATDAEDVEHCEGAEEET